MLILGEIFLGTTAGCLGAQPRTITFSGYDWVVKDSRQRKIAPGPNYYSASASSVWPYGKRKSAGTVPKFSPAGGSDTDSARYGFQAPCTALIR